MSSKGGNKAKQTASKAVKAARSLKAGAAKMLAKGKAKPGAKPAAKATAKSQPKSPAKTSKAAPHASAPRIVRIGARGSPLALAQAHLFGQRLVERSGGALAYTLSTFTTTGDKILDRPLQDAGGKGLFTKELDRAQKDNEIDIAVHSLKDMTVRLPRHLFLAAYLPREDPRDCLIGPWGRIADLPHGAVVGTSSLRRRSQLLMMRPDLKPITFRGNVQTRLRKLAAGEAQATILAAAGLRRLGMIDHAAGIIPIEDMLPAAGQGIIGVTLNVDAPEWLVAACAATDDRVSRLAAIAERAFLRRLDGSCRTPIAAHFRLTETGAEMAGEVLSDEGDRRWRAEGALERIPSERDANDLGLFLAEDVASHRAADLGLRG
jgi:hydroxymethylbilane synthase